ncbi:hypothetical protein BD310DRAFT_940746 [Dichomitus squalens]|uniref:Uncharacterized protein n=1 Tax=Dichomitus squalens TaxID=114155 RepID=A0A4Q9PGI3_9APHY|nr:hypothetical protein BD310DRAFT_940746 [Dichomitus squalens]
MPMTLYTACPISVSLSLYAYLELSAAFNGCTPSASDRDFPRSSTPPSYLRSHGVAMSHRWLDCVISRACHVEQGPAHLNGTV